MLPLIGFVVFVYVLGWVIDTSFLVQWKGEKQHWYQLGTAWMVHQGFLHLSMNVVGMWYLGGELRRVYSEMDVAALFLFGAVSSTAVMALLQSDPVMGASGGVFAMLMAYLMTFWYKRFAWFSYFRWLMPFTLVSVGVALIWPKQAVHVFGLAAGAFWMLVLGRK